MIVAIPVVAIAILLIGNHRSPRQIIKTCFTDAGGLHERDAVRIAGVEVGAVRRIHVDPRNHGCPAEVEMGVTADYDIRIPKDAIAEVQTLGLFGSTFVSIDASHATGQPVERYGYLPGKSVSPPLSMQDYLKAFEMSVSLTAASAKQGETQSKPLPGPPRLGGRSPKP